MLGKSAITNDVALADCGLTVLCGSLGSLMCSRHLAVSLVIQLVTDTAFDCCVLLASCKNKSTVRCGIAWTTLTLNRLFFMQCRCSKYCNAFWSYSVLCNTMHIALNAGQAIWCLQTCVACNLSCTHIKVHTYYSYAKVPVCLCQLLSPI